MNEQELKYGWRVLCKLWHSNNRYCLFYGCSRETLEYWVRETCYVRRTPAFHRRVLNEVIKRGWARKLQSQSGHSMFWLNT